MPLLARTVAIIGPDGSGKTMQAHLLTKRLQNAGYDARYVHSLYYLSDYVPWATWLRQRVGPRRMRTERRHYSRLMYLVRRILFILFGYWFALITILLVTSPSHDRIIVFDRYYQQFFFDIYGPAGSPLSRCLPQPQLTIYLDAEFDTLKPRLDAKDRSVDESYYESVTSVYTECVNANWLQLPAELPADVLHARIFEEVTHRFELDSIALSNSR